MTFQDHYAHAKYGIDEIYFHENFTYELLEKLYRRAAFSLDGEDPLVLKNTSHDKILVFHKQIPSPSLIYRFLKTLNQDVNKESFISSNTLPDEEELFPAIKSKKFVLVTHRTLVKETYTPALS
jgi:hypothetical protein